MNVEKAVSWLSHHSLELFFLPAVLCYDEIVLHVSTTGGYSFASFVVTMLFQIAIGMVLQLIRTCTKRPIPRGIVTTLLLLVTAVFYSAMYIMFLQFKVFYDLNTILFAAKDATQGFGGEIVRLVTSADGIRHIVLFLLPVILYGIGCLYLRKKEIEERPVYDKERRIIVIGCAAVSLAAALLITRATPRLHAVIGKNYSYAAAVQQFGLPVGVFKDAYGIVTGANQQATFTAEANAVPVAKPVLTIDPPVQQEEEEEEEEVIDYGVNALEIDFEELAAAGGAYANIDSYVSTLTPSSKSAYTGLFEGKNLIFITLEAFSGFLIDEELTPTLYRMQHQGIYFTDFYQPSSASTTGGEYSLIKGLLPMAGAASMTNSAYFHNYMTLGWTLSREGYFGQMYHNGDAYYYDRYITHNRIGYSAPYLAYGSGLEQLIETPWPRSDVDMIEATVPLYAEEEHFNVYYMTVSGHAPYSPANSYYAGNPYGTGPNGTNYFAEKNLERVEDLSCSDLLKYYIACQLEVEDMATKLIEMLDEYGVLEETVIVICADHFPYGINDGGGYKVYLEELYGYTIGNDLDRDANSLIIWTPSLEEEEPVQVDTPVSSLDVLPTLLNLFGIDFDSRLLPGRDALSDAPALVFNISHDWKTELGSYTAATGEFTPAEGVRPADVPEGYVEQVSAVVNNKIEFCRSLTYNDYYYHVFGDTLSEGVVLPQIVTPPFPKTEEIPAEEVPAEGEVPTEGAAPAEGAASAETPPAEQPAPEAPVEQPAQP